MLCLSFQEFTLQVTWNALLLCWTCLTHAFKKVTVFVMSFFLFSGATRFHRHEAMVSKLLLGFQLELYDEEGILAEGFSRQLAVDKSL